LLKTTGIQAQASENPVLKLKKNIEALSAGRAPFSRLA
jgi:hypothetical protein